MGHVSLAKVQSRDDASSAARNGLCGGCTRALTAMVLGVALLGEPVTAGMMAGVACVAVGLWMANSAG